MGSLAWRLAGSDLLLASTLGIPAMPSRAWPWSHLALSSTLEPIFHISPIFSSLQARSTPPCTWMLQRATQLSGSQANECTNWNWRQRHTPLDSLAFPWRPPSPPLVGTFGTGAKNQRCSSPFQFSKGFCYLLPSATPQAGPGYHSSSGQFIRYTQ